MKALSELLEMGFWGFVILAGVLFIFTIIWAVIGWALVVFISLFTTVAPLGYFGYTGIGLAFCIIGSVFK